MPRQKKTDTSKKVSKQTKTPANKTVQFGGEDKPDSKVVSKKRLNDEDSDDALLDEEPVTKYNSYDATADNNQTEDVEGDEWNNGDVEEADGDDDIEEGEEEGDMEDGGDIEDLGGNEEEGGDDDCGYNSVRRRRGPNKLSAPIDKEDDDDDEDADINVDPNVSIQDLFVKPEDRRSTRVLTNYERVRLLGDRTAQLAQGAKAMIKGVNGMNPKKIAQLELEAKTIPIKIVRPLPDGKKEVWTLDELQLKSKYIVYGITPGTTEIDTSAIARIDAEHQSGGSIVGYNKIHTMQTYNTKTHVETKKSSSKGPDDQPEKLSRVVRNTKTRK